MPARPDLIDERITGGTDASVIRRGLRLVRMYIGWHPRVFAIAVTGAATYALMTVASTFVLANVIDRVLEPVLKGSPATSSISGLVTVMVLVAVIRSLGIVTRRTFAGFTALRSARSLQRLVTNKYAELPMKYFRTEPTGELLSHMEADVQSAIDVLHPLPYSTAVALLLAFSVVALIATDIYMAIIGCALLPVIMMMNHVFTKKYEPVSLLAQDRIGQVSAVAHESFDGALVVKTLGREAQEAERLSGHADLLRQARLAQGRLRAGFEPTLSLVPEIGALALIAMGSWRVSTGDITVGKLAQFIFLFNLLAFPLRLIGWFLADLPRSLAAFQRIDAVLKTTNELPSPRNPQPIPNGALGLDVHNVHFRYDSTPVLGGVNFTVQPATSVAVVGATGSGKSTLAQLLVRLDDPAGGYIAVGGTDLRTIDPASRASAMSLVLQESYLFVDTIRYNITLGLDVSDEAIRNAARLAQADRFIDRLPNGFDTAMGERGVTLSGGQRQRIALARALVRKPRLLILDDATSAVDPTIEAAILAGLRSELSTTLVVVAYRLSTITLADQVVFLENGRITASGTHRELLAYEPYESMVRAYETSAADMADAGVDHE